MAVTISASQLQTNTAFGSVETLTQSTSTEFQALNLRYEASVLGMGTATGFGVNVYTLATTAVEGQEKLIVSTATGEAKVIVPLPSGRIGIVGSMLTVSAATSVDALQASATGRWVFQSDGDFLLLKFINGAWVILNGSGATQATST